MSEEYRTVGEGLVVFEVSEPVEGPVRWLDSPQEVLDFVASGDVAHTIVLVRGGTTTFLTPALTAGVKGIMTLQGAPESHLGILSREYGIPCLMGVQFEEGMRSVRGEVIPADGARVRLHLDSSPKGSVAIEPGAPVAGADAPTAAPAMSPEEMEQIQLLLTKFGGEVPHGSEGDEIFRQGLSTRVLHLDDESLHRDLTVEECNDLSKYAGWNMWDCLAARATEGESGLIPRQEYESVSFIQIWEKYPEVLRLITDEVGVEGVIDIGATARREVGTKMNILRAWATGFAIAFGRGVSIGLGQTDPSERGEDVAEGWQFMRRLYAGLWGPTAPEGMFSSMRGYRAEILDDDVLDRLLGEVRAFEGAEDRTLFQRFNASTEMLGFLMHFDNRSGLSDTGPYAIGDEGAFAIVRDHFLYDEVYHWADVAEGLPHCVTQVMVFRPTAPLTTQLVDIGTLFTQPANYLEHLSEVAVFARDRWDTPMEDLRLLDRDGMEDVLAHCDAATQRLYRRIAGMPKREKIMAGAQVYWTDFILPAARLAGVWDRLVDELDFHELHPKASEAYYELVKDGTAMKLVPELFLTGQGFPPIEAKAAA